MPAKVGIEIQPATHPADAPRLWTPAFAGVTRNRFPMNAQLHVSDPPDPASADLRIGRRRQVDAHRAIAVRAEADLRRPAVGARTRLEEIRHDRRRYRLRAPRRRARSRARAGHHHRRRLSLLRDRAALVHRRRHARPRAIYPQHGDRRVQRRPRDRARRRAQGAAHADPSPFDHRVAARRAPRRARGQQDRSRRLRRARLPRHCHRLSQVRRAARLPLAVRGSDLGPVRRQCLVGQSRRRHGIRAGICCSGSKPSRSRRIAASAPFRLPVQWINRPHLDFRGFAGTIPSGRVARGEPIVVAGSGKADAVKAHPCRRPGEGDRGSRRRGDADARRRGRHRARRRAGASRQPAGGRRPVHRASHLDERRLDAARPLLSDEDRRANRAGAGHRAQASHRRQQFRQARGEAASISTKSASATSPRRCRSPSTPTATIA